MVFRSRVTAYLRHGLDSMLTFAENATGSSLRAVNGAASLHRSTGQLLAVGSELTDALSVNAN